mmetsp:Transcript_16623/g.42078  ORF Transcript_16623/g.42078 Transcript_16623/m.42078 type:complete len:283 (-) Transcript_16623:741-1589(-)
MRFHLPPALRQGVWGRLYRGGGPPADARGAAVVHQAIQAVRGPAGEDRRRGAPPRGGAAPRDARPSPWPLDPPRVQELRRAGQRAGAAPDERPGGLLRQHDGHVPAHGRDRQRHVVPGAVQRRLRRRGANHAPREGRHQGVCPVPDVQGRRDAAGGGAGHRQLCHGQRGPQEGQVGRGDAPAGQAAPGKGRERQGRHRAAEGRHPGNWKVRCRQGQRRRAVRHWGLESAPNAHGHSLEAARAGGGGCCGEAPRKEPERQAVAAGGAGLRGHDGRWLVRHGPR